MSSYVNRAVRLPPKTLTQAEQDALLKVTGEHRDGFRDHVLYALAFGTALRQHELVALDVGDVGAVVSAGQMVELAEPGELEDLAEEAGPAPGRGGARYLVRQRFPLRVFKRSNRDVSMQEAILPDRARYKLKAFLRWKRQRGESTSPDAPLFVSRHRKRLSLRMVRHGFGVWQERAGFERHLSFHATRHTCLTRLAQATRDPRLVQKVARHKSLLSTAIYMEASDEEVLQAVRKLPC